MTTKKFIRILEEADPSGEAHIRMYGGVPRGAECKPGYWDGPYSYINEQGEWVYSTAGSKVDIWCQDIDEFVSDMVDTYMYPSWEEVKNKFKFELGYTIDSQRKEREDRILNQAKEAYDQAIEMHKKIQEEGEKRATENADKGWKWFQRKGVDDPTDPNQRMHHYYTWKVFDENGKDQGSNLHNVQAVYKSGLFIRIDNDELPGYYEWKKISF